MTAEIAAGPRYVGETYALALAPDRPYAALDGPQGKKVAELFVPSGVDAMEGPDDTTGAGTWTVTEQGDAREFILEAASSLWERKVYRFRCEPRRLTYDIAVEGDGRLTDVCYFGGYSSAWNRFGSGFFPSGRAFHRGWNPEPNAENRQWFDASSDAIIDLVGAPLPGKRHWFFTPAPFCFAFETGSGWLGMGVEARPGENRFTAYRYHGGAGFHLSLAYEGHTQVHGTYRLPAIALSFEESEGDVLRHHVAALRRAGNAAPPRCEEASWWRRPIFCGWGAQCALAARRQGYGGTDPAAPETGAFLTTMRAASEYARQEVYERFMAELACHDLHPGTITIDDKWQATYGGNEVDSAKWPDLAGFIRARHDQGQRVLLWLKAWDIEGLPVGECIRNAAGVPLTVDPTSPAYERRLQAAVRRLLSPEQYDADGFKIDFTHRIPNGPELRTAGDLWGVELMRHLLGIIHGEAKAVKPDALVMAHAPNPYLADVLDMVRLNDMIDLSPLTGAAMIDSIEPVLAHRALVASIACPEAPIDTDNWPVRGREFWREYIRLQPRFGVPSLYFTTHIDLTQETLEDDDYRLIRETWHATVTR